MTLGQVAIKKLKISFFSFSISIPVWILAVFIENIFLKGQGLTWSLNGLFCKFFAPTFHLRLCASPKKLCNEWSCTLKLTTLPQEKVKGRQSIYWQCFTQNPAFNQMFVITNTRLFWIVLSLLEHQSITFRQKQPHDTSFHLVTSRALLRALYMRV